MKFTKCQYSICKAGNSGIRHHLYFLFRVQQSHNDHGLLVHRCSHIHMLEDRGECSAQYLICKQLICLRKSVINLCPTNQVISTSAPVTVNYEIYLFYWLYFLYIFNPIRIVKCINHVIN